MLQADQNISYGSVGDNVRSVKWWHKILYYVLDVTVSNARVLYNATRRTARLAGKDVPGPTADVSRREFIKLLCHGLWNSAVGEMIRMRNEDKAVHQPCVRQDENGTRVRRRCVVCLRANVTRLQSTYCPEPACKGVHLCATRRSHERSQTALVVSTPTRGCTCVV